jgi:hypothetical protein
MSLMRRSCGVLLLIACLVSGRANAAATTNFSDQWWIPGESGWGASVLQQWDTLFIDLFVYGTDNKPTWFVAAATLQSATGGHVMFTGDLYATSGGAYFGAPFNPATVSARKVGTLTFDASGTTSATLTYIVDGTQVVKSVTRQTWRAENLTGSYYGGIVSDRTGCNNPANNGHSETPANFQISHLADNSIAILAQIGASSCTITGTYTQAGHLGEIDDGRGPCDDGGRGVSFIVFEMEQSLAGFTARFLSLGDAGGDQCRTLARIGGVRR